MNYPIWEVPAAGLLIAGIAILHVFISHFAVGGGLFLVLLERKAYREGDGDLLGFTRGHTRFFLLLTLVLGAITGVGIWFTISLVHPQATSTLIQIFVWIWAIEWTFFLTEITAAMVYYYGWDHMSRRVHLIVGWIYFGSAWMSLAVINGIITFMLTPGGWLESGSVWEAFFNPTYLPSLVTRTLVAVGLAGLYAIFAASFLDGSRLKREVISYSGVCWLLPATACLPLALFWYLFAASGSGVPVAEILGVESGSSPFSTLYSVLWGSGAVGIPLAQRGLWLSIGTCSLIFLAALVIIRRRSVRPSVALGLMILGLVSFGGAEWIREDLRKPYVLGRYMFVNGIRLSAEPYGAPPEEDSFSISAINREGVLRTSLWLDKRPSSAMDGLEEEQNTEGRQVFRLLCGSCHTVSGHQAISDLVAGQTEASLSTLLDQLAKPLDSEGKITDWSGVPARLQTWRGRRMPPFAGTDEEKTLLADFLVSLAGVRDDGELEVVGRSLFEAKCLFCHGPEANWPLTGIAEGRTAAEFYDRIGRLPEINPIMPPFEGTEFERKQLSAFLESYAASRENIR